MDETVAQLLALLLAALFWIAEAVLRRRRSGALSRRGAGPKSVESDEADSRRQASVPQGADAGTAGTPGAVSAAAGAQGGPKARARNAAGRIWRGRVRDERVRQERDRHTALMDGAFDLSLRLRELEGRAPLGLRPAVFRLRELLESIESHVGSDPGGGEIERLSQALGVAKRSADVLDVLAEVRRGDSGRWLRISDRVLAAIHDAVSGLGPGFPLTLHRDDLGWQRTLVDAGLTPVSMPEGWTDDVAAWPIALEGALKALLQRSLLGRQIFERVGLTPNWVVPYSKPAYLSSAQVVGTYGPWLAVLITDILALSLWGSAWARLVTRQLGDSGEDPLEVRAGGAGIHIDGIPPHYLRLWCIAAVLDRLDLGAEAEHVRGVVGRWAEPGHVLLSMPTRRGERYVVEGRPFLDAGKALVEFVCDEPFDALDARSLLDSWDLSRYAAQRSLARALRSGGTVGRERDILLLIGAAMEAFVESEFDVRVSAGLAMRSLGAFEADMKVSSKAGRVTSRGVGPGQISADLVVEAVVLGSILGGPAWGASPQFRRVVGRSGLGRGRL